MCKDNSSADAALYVPYQHSDQHKELKLSTSEFSLLIKTAGETALGLGRAIDGLARNNQTVTAQELSTSLLYIAKKVSWALKLAVDSRSTS
jgi:hypothetical protein